MADPRPGSPLPRCRAEFAIRKWSDNGQFPRSTPGRAPSISPDKDLNAFLDRSGPGARAKEGPTVLLIDDDQGVRELVRITLEQEGYRVREAEAPTKA